MSAVFGIFHTDQRPVAPEKVARMDAAMAYWGPEGGGLHLKGPLALGSRLLRITAEDQFETQPLIDGPHVLVAHGRLDNRDDLCRQLGLTPRTELTESALMLAAYRRYGDDCVQHLRGDWVFALWDESRQTLLVARDATGNTGLYWWFKDRTFVFATGLKGVIAHPDVPRQPDPLALASLLTVFTNYAATGATMYQEVHRLTPGHLLKVDANGVHPYRWWRPEQLLPLKLPSLADYDEAFMALYSDVVGQRLRVHGGTVAATLSAGLDSGSVVALAAPRLAQQGRRLKAYVHTPLYEPQGEGHRHTGNEFPLAQKTAQHVGNVDAIALRSESISVLQGIEKALWMHDEPGQAASNEYWITDVLQTARDDGARVLLTGQGGNRTVSFNGDGNLWRWLRAGRWSDAATAVLQERAGVWSACKYRLIKPAVLPVRARIKRAVASFQGADAWMLPSAINPSFVHELRLRERMRAEAFDPLVLSPLSRRSTMNAFRFGTLGGGAAWAMWMEKGAAFGLDVRDPTRDQRLVEFCCRLPDEVFWGRGEQRALIRRAMSSRLPPEVLSLKRKGLQSADLGGRVLSVQAELEKGLERLESNPLVRGWLNLGFMKMVLSQLREKCSPPTVVKGGAVLLKGWAAGQFLERF